MRLKAYLSLPVLLWFPIHNSRQSFRLHVRILFFNFRRPFTNYNFVELQNKFSTTSILLMAFLPLLLCYWFAHLFPIFQKAFFVTVQSPKLCFTNYAYVLISMFCDIIFSKILSLSSGDVVTNHDPRKSCFIKFRRWNLNDLAAKFFSSYLWQKLW